MFGYIYKITNKINGKIYVGKHKYDKPEIDESYWCSGSYIMRSINKYGTENFTRELICICETLEELNEKEKYWISTLNSMDKNIGYNLTRGGDGTYLCGESNYAYGTKRSTEDKERLSKKLKSIWSDPNSVFNSDEYRMRLSQSGKNRKESLTRNQNISLAKMGHEVSEECRAKISEKISGSKWYNNGVIQTQAHECPEGFVEGMLPTTPRRKPGMGWYNNGIENRMFFPDSVPEGYTKGIIKLKK